MSDKPLHVRVAEALGWTDCLPFEAWGVVDPEHWVGTPPGWTYTVADIGKSTEPPRYDTDWSATGPLIERLGIHIEPDACHEPEWLAFVLHGDEQFSVSEATQPTPLLAVCHCILALKEAGKLPA
jgi:hypothetical protein